MQTSQKRAVRNYRDRQAAQGLARFEVQGLDMDRKLIRTLARQLDGAFKQHEAVGHVERIENAGLTELLGDGAPAQLRRCSMHARTAACRRGADCRRWKVRTRRLARCEWC